jgi:hypothetical protein
MPAGKSKNRYSLFQAGAAFTVVSRMEMGMQSGLIKANKDQSCDPVILPGQSFNQD